MVEKHLYNKELGTNCNAWGVEKNWNHIKTSLEIQQEKYIIKKRNIDMNKRDQLLLLIRVILRVGRLLLNYISQIIKDVRCIKREMRRLLENREREMEGERERERAITAALYI